MVAVQTLKGNTDSDRFSGNNFSTTQNTIRNNFRKMKSPTETPASKVVCESQDCGKEYASKGGMKNHYKKTHKSLEEIQSPLGKFPAIDPARILFNESDPSTQGNSKGQVNSPKVTTCGQYICNVCDNYFESKQDIDEHKKKEHDISSPTARETDSGSQDPTASPPPTDTSSSMTRELYQTLLGNLM